MELIVLFQEVCSVGNPKNCTLCITFTYFFSAILSLIMKNLIGRKILMLISSLGMVESQSALGASFYLLAQRISANMEFCVYFDINNTNHSDQKFFTATDIS